MIMPKHWAGAGRYALMVNVIKNATEMKRLLWKRMLVKLVGADMSGLTVKWSGCVIEIAQMLCKKIVLKVEDADMSGLTVKWSGCATNCDAGVFSFFCFLPIK